MEADMLQFIGGVVIGLFIAVFAAISLARAALHKLATGR